jgi:hypothetical protein
VLGTSDSSRTRWMGRRDPASSRSKYSSTSRPRSPRPLGSRQGSVSWSPCGSGRPTMGGPAPGATKESRGPEDRSGDAERPPHALALACRGLRGRPSAASDSASPSSSEITDPVELDVEASGHDESESSASAPLASVEHAAAGLHGWTAVTTRRPADHQSASAGLRTRRSGRSATPQVPPGRELFRCSGTSARPADFTINQGPRDPKAEGGRDPGRHRRAADAPAIAGPRPVDRHDVGDAIPRTRADGSEHAGPTHPPGAEPYPAGLGRPHAPGSPGPG